MPNLIVYGFVSQLTKEIMPGRMANKKGGLKYILSALITFSSASLFIYTLTRNISRNQQVILCSFVLLISVISGITKGMLVGGKSLDRLLHFTATIIFYFLPIAYFIIAIKSPWGSINF